MNLCHGLLNEWTYAGGRRKPPFVMPAKAVIQSL